MNNPILEGKVSKSNLTLIKSCSATAAGYLRLDLLKSTPEAIIHGLDELVYEMQNGKQPKIESEEIPQYLFGSLWGEQLVRKLGWEWTQLTFREYDDASVVCVRSPDRSLVIYPFDFIEDCLDSGVPVTIELAFNMLVDGRSIPKIPPGSYEDIMESVHHLVPRG